MSAAPRILFRCPGKRGLGHLVRGLNIAREVRALEPSADIRFYTRGAAAPKLVGREFPCAVEAGSGALVEWDRLVAEQRPDVVVDDTLLRDEGGALPAGARRAYVMRKSKDERHRAIVASPLLSEIDVVIVPHTEAEFGHALPDAVVSRTVFTGPIIRRPTDDGMRRATAPATATSCSSRPPAAGGSPTPPPSCSRRRRRSTAGSPAALRACATSSCGDRTSSARSPSCTG